MSDKEALRKKIHEIDFDVDDLFGTLLRVFSVDTIEEVEVIFDILSEMSIDQAEVENAAVWTKSRLNIRTKMMEAAIPLLAQAVEDLRKQGILEDDINYLLDEIIYEELSGIGIIDYYTKILE